MYEFANYLKNRIAFLARLSLGAICTASHSSYRKGKIDSQECKEDPSSDAILENIKIQEGGSLGQQRVTHAGSWRAIGQLKSNDWQGSAC